MIHSLLQPITLHTATAFANSVGSRVDEVLRALGRHVPEMPAGSTSPAMRTPSRREALQALLRGTTTPWQRPASLTHRALRFAEAAVDPFKIHPLFTSAYEGRITDETLDELFQGQLPRQQISVEGFGEIGVRDSRLANPEAPSSVTVIFSHGLMCTGDLMWADILLKLLSAQTEGSIPPLRIVTVDFPGHGRSSKPNPREFDYNIHRMASVTFQALQQLNLSGKIIHVTESLGHILNMFDDKHMFDAMLHYGSSPCQWGFDLGCPFATRLPKLGDRSVLEYFLAQMKQEVLEPADLFYLLHLVLGQGAPVQVSKSWLSNYKDLATIGAQIVMLQHLGEFVDEGKKLAERPRPNVPHIVVGGAHDLVATTASQRRYHQELVAGGWNKAELILVPGASHFGMDGPERQKILDRLIQLIKGFSELP